MSVEDGDTVRYNNALLEQVVIEMKMETAKLEFAAAKANLDREQLLLKKAGRTEANGEQSKRENHGTGGVNGEHKGRIPN